MKRKIICISMVGLLLLTGVSSLSAIANQLEQNTPEVETLAGESKITVKGGLSLKVKITPDASIQNKNFIYSIRVQFNDEPTIHDSGTIGSFPVSYSTGLLFSLRMWDILNSRSGSVQVTVKIYKQLEPPVQEVVIKGTFFGPFISIK